MYPSFVPARKLMRKLANRFQVPRQFADITDYNDWERKVLPIKLRVCNIIKNWITNLPQDFRRDLDLQHQLEQLITLLAKSPEVMWNKIGFALQNSIKKNVELSSHQREIELQGDMLGIYYMNYWYAPQPLNTSKDIVDIWDVKIEDIANQLTLIESALYTKIGRDEMLVLNWLQPRKRYPDNISVLLSRFNDTIDWITASILQEKEGPKRVKRIVDIIDLAVQVHRLHNYHTLTAILTALSKPTLSGLKSFEFIKKHSRENLKKLQNVISSSENYKNFRNELHTVDPPCIPYLQVYLQDLVSIVSAFPNVLTSNGHINFRRCENIYATITEVQQWQQNRYFFAPKQAIINFFYPTMHIPSCSMME